MQAIHMQSACSPKALDLLIHPQLAHIIAWVVVEGIQSVPVAR